MEGRDEMLEMLSNPYALTAALVLSLISTAFFIYGVRQKNLFHFLVGIGTGIPTLAITSWRFWVAGGLVCLLGWWLHNRVNSAV